MNRSMRADFGTEAPPNVPRIDHARERSEKTPGLSRALLAGRLTEFSGQGNLANLTLACGLIFDAQHEGETTAWITGKEATFYPPDAARIGIDLSALAVVRCPDRGSIVRTADRLARSGAFGLLILDLGVKADIPLPQQSRLGGLARKHNVAIVFLTQKTDDAPSIGSLISLRGKTLCQREANGRFACSFEAVKDKHRGPGWVWKVVHHGAPGLY